MFWRFVGELQVMEDFNQTQQLPTLQERFAFMGSLRQPLCELMTLLMHYFKMYHQEILESGATRLVQEREDNWRSLNLENPGMEEYKAVTTILSTQTELLQQDYNQGRDASRKLLMALLRSLWKYFMFHSQGSPALTPNFTSLNNPSETETFHQAILRLSANIQRNIPDRGAAFKQDVKMILYHLKNWETQDLQSTRELEDQELDILDVHPEL